MQCYSDPAYDLQLNNLIENEIELSPIQKLSNQRHTNTSIILLDDSFDENLLSLTHESKLTDQLKPDVIVPFELYDSDELKQLEKESIKEAIIQN